MFKVIDHSLLQLHLNILSYFIKLMYGYEIKKVNKKKR